MLLIQHHAIWLTNCTHRGRAAHSPAVSTGSWTDFSEARIKSKSRSRAGQHTESSPLMHARAAITHWLITDRGPVFDVPLRSPTSSCLPVNDWHTGSWVYLSQTLCSARSLTPWALTVWQMALSGSLCIAIVSHPLHKRVHARRQRGRGTNTHTKRGTKPYLVLLLVPHCYRRIGSEISWCEANICKRRHLPCLVWLW